jgi:extracellular elastinolytic metalloproteinase
VATGDGVRQLDLIDDTERSNWHSGGAPVQGRQVTVELGGGSHRLDRAQVSAYLTLENEDDPEMPPDPPTPGTQNRFTALRQFELWGCSANPANAMCAGPNNAGWGRIYRSDSDFFPTDPPRPVAPEINLRGFDLGSGNRVTHVRLVVLHNQCTGNTAFHGDQDNDPGMNADCRAGSPPNFLPRGNDVRAAELQLYSNEHRVRGASLVGAGGGDDDDGDDDDDD